ncbi:MAG: DUF2281 domain-containing protein [Bacteroidetes bacterium]|jgi:hypothetical protein|nr:DUF2281 domain-containing protein [Bacteroidota bacterium]
MSVEEMVKMLPEDLQQEVRDFVQFLLERGAKRGRAPLKFEWEGAIENLRDSYTSVQLQHKVSEWRIGDS